jgi:hypothetical protein
VDDIAKAVSGAMSSILSKLQNRNQEKAETKPIQTPAVLTSSSLYLAEKHKEGVVG